MHTKVDLGAPTPTLGPSPAPTDLGLDIGLEAPIGEIPEGGEGEGALPEATPVGEGGFSPGVEIAPPEAGEAQEFGVGAPGGI